MTKLHLHIIVALVISCASSSAALELNFAGEETSIPTGETYPGRERPLSVNLRSQFYGRNISGDVGRSLWEGKPHYQNIVSISYRRPLGSNLLRLRTDLRNSDDPTLQREKLGVLGLALTFENEGRYSFRLGDLYLRGGRYCFQRSVQGASYNHNLQVAGGKLKLQAGYGRLYKGIEKVQFARFLSAGGLHWEGDVEMSRLKGLKLSFGYSRTWDKQGSIKQKEGLSANRNDVLSFGAEVRFERELNLSLEFAGSRFEESVGEEINDKAIFLELEKGLGFGRLRASFEEVGGKFRSLAASGYPDTRRMSACLNAGILKNLYLFGGFNFHRDNLDGDKDVTTKALSQNLSLSYRPLKMLLLSSNLNFSSHRAGEDLRRNVFGLSHRISVQLRGWNLSTSFNRHTTRDKFGEARSGGGFGLSASHSRLFGMLISKLLREFSGGTSISLDRRWEGSGGIRNSWTSMRLRSSGGLGNLRYLGGIGLEDAGLSSGDGDYRRFSWDISSSYVLGAFEFGILLEGSNLRDVDPAESYHEVATKVQFRTLF